MSADLALTHDESGPHGLDPAAEPFDTKVKSWASSLNEAPLRAAANLVDGLT